MKLQAKFNETRIVYAFSTWEWDNKRQVLTQHVPTIEEIKFATSKQRVFIGQGGRVPTLWEGQLVKLDGCAMYVTHIDVTYFASESVFVYLMSEVKPEISTWWAAEVEDVRGEHSQTIP